LACVTLSAVSSPLALFFFTATPPTAIYTLSLHDALPICTRIARHSMFIATCSRCSGSDEPLVHLASAPQTAIASAEDPAMPAPRSEEHTSELQSLTNLVCRLLLAKKNIQSRR